MMTYKYKFYKTKKTRHIDDMLREACFVWNHALALQRRYYRLYRKYADATAMQKHFARRIKRTYLHSQSAQEVLQRLDKAYKRFFDHIARRPPKFKKTKDFSSFVYKQGGFSLCGNVFHVNSVKRDYRFSLSRPYTGKVRNVRVKRSHLGEYYICITTDAKCEPYAKTHDGASVGIDFGLKTYMTFSDGTSVDNPQYMRRELNRLRRLSRRLSRCESGSYHRERSRLALCRQYERVTDCRRDFQWKLAHCLCRRYDTVFIEDLNLNAIKRLWGRKVSDLAHGEFCLVLDQVAAKYGCRVHRIDKWFPSSKLCECGYKNDNLTLRDRTWACPHCGQVHDRDVHASEMILRRGIYELASGSKTLEPLGFCGSHV